MNLTPGEKNAGRSFRATAQAHLTAINDSDPPTYIAPPHIAIYRHLCPARAHRSTALVCNEMYLYSPASPDDDVPKKRFGFIWRAGTCRYCGATARSDTGRLVDAIERPPLRPN